MTHNPEANKGKLNKYNYIKTEIFCMKKQNRQ